MFSRNRVVTSCSTAVIVLLTPVAARGQVIRIDEIEACKVRCDAGSELQKTIWASNRDVTPAYWGRKPGDSVEWTIELRRPERQPRLGNRHFLRLEPLLGDVPDQRRDDEDGPHGRQYIDVPGES